MDTKERKYFKGMRFLIKHFDTKGNNDNKEVILVQNEEAENETEWSLNPNSENFQETTWYIPSSHSQVFTFFFFFVIFLTSLSFIYYLCLIITFFLNTPAACGSSPIRY